MLETRVRDLQTEHSILEWIKRTFSLQCSQKEFLNNGSVSRVEGFQVVSQWCGLEFEGAGFDVAGGKNDFA